MAAAFGARYATMKRLWRYTNDCLTRDIYSSTCETPDPLD